MEHRNQQDVSIWLSHIQFLKTNGWEEGVSRLYLRLLQVIASNSLLVNVILPHLPGTQ